MTGVANRLFVPAFMAGHGVPHHAEKDEHKRVGIFIAVLAVIMSIVAAMAKQAANTMIVKEVQSSNGFAWYQSKRQRSYLNELELKRIEVALAGDVNEAQRKLLTAQQSKLAAKNAEYEKENKDIQAAAEADKKLAEVAAHQHHWFEYGEICLHIAVVLCSLNLLTDQKLFLKLGALATAAGIVLAALAWRGHAHEPGPAPKATSQGSHH